VPKGAIYERMGLNLNARIASVCVVMGQVISKRGGLIKSGGKEDRAKEVLIRPGRRSPECGSNLRNF